MWIDVKDKLPKNGQTVFVKVNDAHGVAQYDKDFGFSADSSAYDIYVSDDSGLNVTLDGNVTYWMTIPN